MGKRTRTVAHLAMNIVLKNKKKKQQQQQQKICEKERKKESKGRCIHCLRLMVADRGWRVVCHRCGLKVADTICMTRVRVSMSRAKMILREIQVRLEVIK